MCVRALFIYWGVVGVVVVGGHSNIDGNEMFPVTMISG